MYLNKIEYKIDDNGVTDDVKAISNYRGKNYLMVIIYLSGFDHIHYTCSSIIL